MQMTLHFPCAYAYDGALHITFDVLDQIVQISESTFDKLMREIERRSKKRLSVVDRALSHIVSSIGRRQRRDVCARLLRRLQPVYRGEANATKKRLL